MHKKQQYRGVLDDVCADYCSPDHYCILKEFLIHSAPSPRLLMQMKCVEKLKYERSQQAGREVTWTEAMQQWVDEGLAKKFSHVYKEDVKFRDLYRALSNSPQHTDRPLST